MWILIAIAVAVVLALAFLVWRRSPRVTDDVQQWKLGLDALGRTAGSPPLGGPPPPSEPESPVDSVRVLGPGESDRDDDG